MDLRNQKMEFNIWEAKIIKNIIMTGIYNLKISGELKNKMCNITKEEIAKKKK